MSKEHATELLNHLVASMRGILEAEAEQAARDAEEEKRFARLTEDLRTLPQDRLRLAEAMIQQLAGSNTPSDVPF